MDLKDKKKFGFARLLRSFAYAWTGLKYVLKYEQNMWIHLVIGVLVLLLAYILSIPFLQILVLIVVIGGVLSLEIMNTAVEKTIDFITDEFHPQAKVVKDVAAAAVFIFSLVAAIIGIFIFLPPLLRLIM